MAPALVENAVNCNKEIVRLLANFSPSLWGDHFMKYASDTQLKQEYSKDIEVLKNEVGSMLKPSGSNIVDALNLIDILERLGVSYHLENEIEKKLEQLFNLNTNYEDETYDLYTVALHFRVFRQHGYRISSDIFSKFRDGDGKFQEGLKSDPRGWLSLYEAAHLRIHGEEILEDALTFATSNLKSMAQNLSSPLRKQVEHALVQPLHFNIPRLEARNFISIYEEFESKNETLLRFAKLDFNLLQILHKEELLEVSRWYTELDCANKFPYARDRLVECYFWAMGLYHEPQYSRARIILTKTFVFVSITDDTYDSYGTIEELDVLTEAIDRWDISQIDKLPDYAKLFYKDLLELYAQFEQELAKEGRSYAVYYAIEALKELAKGYNVEAKWFKEGYLPPFDEYLKNGLITSTFYYDTMTSLLGIESVTEEEFKLLSQKPKIVVANLKNCRLIDDIATYEIEKERGQIATGIECYMKDNGVTKEEAMNKFDEMVTNTWKDMNEECLMPFSNSREVLMRIIGLSRTTNVTYKNYEDGYTMPEKVLEPHIIALYMDSIKIPQML
ncbi:hypothetical protein DH2020_043427 [Rehmannia glutinosa]|uniref:Uncharacterized protein n=1 Tax=Rehmannia glutinosa TaxID=99300 RepID=A0ABR0ULF3_REHGL